MVRQLAVVGCGLMGGSFALALKRAGLVSRVVGYSRSASTLDLAQRLGVIDEAADSAAAAAAGSDLVLVAVPVAATEDTLRAIRDSLAAGTLVMDVGSTKRDVVEAARRALDERLPCFVPAHPIAGKESAGVQQADATLYAARQVVLTPLPETPSGHLRRATELWTAVGSRVLAMSPERHDAAFAAVSHLPHLLAFAYIAAVAAAPDATEQLALAGPGFRDFTRIAASDPAVWRDILLANRDEVLAQAQRLRDSLATFEQAMRAGDASALEALIRQASDLRSQWQMNAAAAPLPDPPRTP